MRRRARQRESKRQVGSAVASSGESALSSRSRRTMRRSVPTITAARRVGRSERDELIRVMDDGEKLGLANLVTGNDRTRAPHWHWGCREFWRHPTSAKEASHGTGKTGRSEPKRELEQESIDTA